MPKCFANLESLARNFHSESLKEKFVEVGILAALYYGEKFWKKKAKAKLILTVYDERKREDWGRLLDLYTIDTNDDSEQN